MRKVWLFFLFLVAIGTFSCKQENELIQNEDDFIPDSEMRRFLETHFLFSPSAIVETKTGFTVEEAVYFEKKDFWERYTPPKTLDKKHYRSQYKVKLSTVSVSLSNLPAAWKTAFQSAFTKWNALKSGIKFTEITGYCPANGITVQYSSLGTNTGNTFAMTSGFPTASGNPGNVITVNSSCTVTMNASQKLKTALHELGHAIGFMHTDNASGYMQILTGLSNCNTNMDINSFLRQGLMSFTDFSMCDKAAIKVVYP